MRLLVNPSSEDLFLKVYNAQQKADKVVDAITAAGGQALAMRADSADVTAVKSAVAATVRTLGRLNVLVTNAGIAVVAPLDAFSLDDFDHMVAVNVRGVFVAIQEASRHMGAGGRIITIGSVNADRMPFPGGSVYAMTKAAVAGLTRGLARDLGPRGITINNVQPGPVDTDMNPADGPFAESMKGMMALGRYGLGDEIAGLVAYLASPDAGFITGASPDHRRWIRRLSVLDLNMSLMIFYLPRACRWARWVVQARLRKLPYASRRVTAAMSPRAASQARRLVPLLPRLLHS